MNLLPTSHRSRSFVLLAPQREYPKQFVDVYGDRKLYAHVLSEVQRFRGKVYVSEGNLLPGDLSTEGRHVQAADYNSWHLITLDESDSVAACARMSFHDHSTGFSDLLVSHSALSHSDRWGSLLRQAVEAEIGSARRRQIRFAELGGWAVTRRLRCTTEAVRLVLAGYALGQLLGGTLGVSTVNVHHHSASILRRIGGLPLLAGGTQLPAFYEPQYRAELEILLFDSHRPNPRYDHHIQQCRTALAEIMVICAEPRSAYLRSRPCSSRIPYPTAPFMDVS
jgi:hypothetical protein